MSKRITELEQTLRQASDAYYNSDTTTMSDDQFDRLKAELQELDPNNAFLAEVGAPLAEHLQKVTHTIPMGSLSNCTKEGDKANPSYAKWHESRGNPEVCVMHKLDGSSVEVIYKDGKLVQAITRGDGFTGEDITKNARKFKGVPDTIPTGFSGSVRGEALLLLEDFEKGFKDQANPRNAANGTVRRSDGSRAEYISFIGYDIIGDTEYNTMEQKLRHIRELGFQPCYWEIRDKAGDVVELHDEISRGRLDLPYEIDGLVIKVNDCASFDELGERDNRPKGGIAFKFKAMGATTKLLGVKLSIGHTGAIVPTADLAPVEIGGVTVSSALLNNFGEIERLRLAIGDEVKVIRAGDVIPKVVGVAREAPDREPIVPPSECISCGSTLEQVAIKSQSKNERPGYHLICSREDCPGKSFRILKSWVDKRNILFLGEGLLITLYESFGVRAPEDLYRLTEDELARMPSGAGVVGSNAKRIMEQIEKSRQCPLSEFVGSLGIRFLGRRQAEIMVSQGVDSLRKFLTLTPQELAGMEGFSETKAVTIIDGLKKMAKRMKNLLDNGVVVLDPKQTQTAAGGPMAGRIICFTGVRPSQEEENRFVLMGGTVKSGVSKALTHLVVARVDTNSSKARKAREYGVDLVSFDDFRSWLS